MIVERCLQIISEASRSLPDDLKSRHSDIPWAPIAAIGNRLRHEYDDILPDILWTIVTEDLSPLAQVCEEGLAREERRETHSPAGKDSHTARARAKAGRGRLITQQSASRATHGNAS